MEAVIRKWGNSPALRLSSAVMKAARFELDQKVVVKAESGRIVIEPVAEPSYTLDELVAAITPRNRHSEVDTGAPVGREAL